MPGVLHPRLPSCQVVRKAPVLKSRGDFVLTHLLSLLGTGWLARKKTEAAKRITVYILNNPLLRNVAIHFPGFLTAYCSCDCIEEKLVALDLGWLSRVLMHLSGGAAAGLQGSLCSCSFRSELCSNQHRLQSNRKKKKIPLGHELFLFSWLSPLAKLTEFSSQRYPPNPFPPPNSLPHPQMSLQLSYKQINFSKF